MSYRDDLDALAARHAALDSEVAVKTRERDAARVLLDDAKARSRLPVLDNIRIASPCTADWNQMTGDDRARACGTCNKTVYNLSEMTRDEAEALITAREGQLCARYYQRSDGTILLADCTIGARRRRRRRWIAAGAAALLAGGGAAALLSEGSHSEPTMGTLAPPVVEDVPIVDHYPVPEQLVPQHDPPDYRGGSRLIQQLGHISIQARGE